MEHELKIWPEFFQPIISGEKTFELRRDDRGYRAGDTLLLREWKSCRYTGRTSRVLITYILGGLGLQNDWIVMAIKPLTTAPPSS